MKHAVALTVTLLSVLIGIGFAADAADQETQIVGKQGWVLLESDTKVGGSVLKPGIYYMRHENAEGTQHVLSFQKVGDPDLALQYSDKGLVGEPIRVTCKLRRLPARAKHTTVTTVRENGGHRITQVEIKGENVIHVLP